MKTFTKFEIKDKSSRSNILIKPKRLCLHIVILMGLFVLINGQTTQSSLITSFMGYTIQYQDFDSYSCITATTTVIPDETSTICLTSTEAVATTEEITTTTSTTTTTTTSTTTTSTTTTVTTSTTTSTTTTSTTTSTTTTVTTSTTTSTTSTTTTTASTTTASTTTTATTSTTTSTTTTVTTTSTTTTSTTTTSTTTSTTSTTTTSTTTATTTSTTTTSTTTTATTSTTTTTTSTTTSTTTTGTTTTTTTVTIITTVATTISGTAGSASAITITSVTSKTVSASGPAFVPPTCANNGIGFSCNVSTNPCAMTQPCLNLATCYPNISLPTGYLCACIQGFFGMNCQVDGRACRDSICLNGGVCNQTSNDSSCICPTGKTGEHCEYKIDVCAQITCQNSGQCISSYGNWSCKCTNTALYSGNYCEKKSTSLVIKEYVSLSFACVAIGCLSAVVGFILIMDILKYGFHINPAKDELGTARQRRAYERKEERQHREHDRNYYSRHPVVAVRFQYVHA